MKKYGDLNLGGMNDPIDRPWRMDGNNPKPKLAPQPKENKKIGLLRLWLLGLGIPLSVLENERVKFELDQKQIDGAGMLQALQGCIYYVPNTTTEAVKNLQDPRYQLELITLLNNEDGSMLFFEK